MRGCDESYFYVQLYFREYDIIELLKKSIFIFVLYMLSIV